MNASAFMHASASGGIASPRGSALPCCRPARAVATASLALLLLAATAPATAAEVAPTGPAVSQVADTLTLGALQAAAVRHDPHSARPGLEAEASALRLQNLTTARRPQLSLTGESSYSSDVISFPFTLPGSTPPSVPHDRYEAAATADWLLLDGGRTDAMRGLEMARLDLTGAMVDAELHDLRLQVTNAFLSALVVQERRAAIDLLIEDLNVRASELAEAVAVGVALPGDTALLRAEILSAGQRRTQLQFERLAALDILSDLTGIEISEDATLPLPDLSTAVLQVDPSTRTHPQFDVFDAERVTLERQVSAIDAQDGLRAAVFGRYALGTPGPRQFEKDPYGYWSAGVRLEWRPWDWDSGEREIETTRVTSRIVDTREAAFAASLQRAIRRPLRTMERLEQTMRTDEEIIALRAQVEVRNRVQLAENAIPASEWVTARNNLLDARIALATHRIELVWAQAEYLTILGTEINR